MNIMELKGIKLLDGMYSFSIYDKNINKVFLCRDFLVKSLFTFLNIKVVFIGASELKSIKNIFNNKYQFKISKKALSIFMKLTYIPSPLTIYENVFKLEPNKILTYNCNNQEYTIKNIHSKKEKIESKKINLSFEEAKKITRELVFESVSSRAVADVPIGTFLSGGVDSSIVSYCLAKSSRKKINTFSIGFKNKFFDESEKISIVSKLINSKHHCLYVDSKQFQ